MKLRFRVEEFRGRGGWDCIGMFGELAMAKSYHDDVKRVNIYSIFRLIEVHEE